METIGTVGCIARYPVKSMGGEELSTAVLGLNGIPGDRMYAFVQAGTHSPFPWLTAREYPGLLRYQPFTREVDGRPALFVRTDSGAELLATSEELRAYIEAQAQRPVHLHTDHRGNHDVAYVSIITRATLQALAEAAGVAPDHRRFRMNIVVEGGTAPFGEREWVGKTVTADGARLVVTEQDRRCVMITLDPDGGDAEPAVLKRAGELNGACAGVYASVAAAGAISIGEALQI